MKVAHTMILGDNPNVPTSLFKLRNNFVVGHFRVCEVLKSEFLKMAKSEILLLCKVHGHYLIGKFVA